MATPTRAVLPPESERHFQAAVLELAHLLHWRVYHTFDSRRSVSGFPDLVLVRPPRVLLAELKRESGQLTSAQRDWLEDLRACGLQAFVWRPSDWSLIVATLEAAA